MVRVSVGPSLAVCLTLAVGTSAWAAPIQWSSGVGGNDNWYELVLASDGAPTDWDAARLAAAAMNFMGAAGHLVTITSAGENTFLADSFNTGSPVFAAFAGGSDAAVEGTWRWVVGPEAGQLFTFTAWSGGEPNNVGGVENYLTFNVGPGGVHGHGLWIDVPLDLSTNPEYAGYLVEWEAADIDPNAAVPEPATLLLLGTGLAAAGARRRRAAKKEREG